MLLAPFIIITEDFFKHESLKNVMLCIMFILPLLWIENVELAEKGGYLKQIAFPKQKTWHLCTHFILVDVLKFISISTILFCWVVLYHSG